MVEVPGPPSGRPSLPALVLAQTRYAMTDFLRTPVAAFFTLAFPLIWLGAVVVVTGNPVVDEQTGRRLAQFVTGSAVVFATVMSCFSAMPVAVAVARDRGVLKRLHGTPLPAWTYVAGRVVAASVVSVAAAVVVVTVAVVSFGVEPVWRTGPATVVTLLTGVACFSALGLAVVSLTRDAKVVQAVTPAVVVSLAFLSGLFVDGAALPDRVRRVGEVLPMEPFASSLGAQLDPYGTGSGWYVRDLAVMLAWGALGTLVAVRRFRWEPRRAAPDRHPATVTGPAASGGAGRVPGQVRRSAADSSRPSPLRLLGAQTRYATRELWRDRTSTFFAVGLPLLLLVLVSTLVDADAEQQGMPLPQYLTGAMTAYGIFVTGYATLPGAVAAAQESGVLKRLRGTPLPFGLYLAGRVLAAVVLGALTFLVLLAVAVTSLGVGVDVRTLPAVVVTLLLGTGCAAALGLALAAVVRPAKAVPAVALGTLLPLAFISDVFVFGAAPPQWVQVVASVFPLKPFAVAMAVALDPTTPGEGLRVGSLAVLLAWTVLGAVVATTVFGRASRGAGGAGQGRTTREVEPVA